MERSPPVPVNIFHSYLRRWNNFSGMAVDQDAFLTWVDDYILITRCHLTTAKVLAGKKGAVTGFTGAIELSLTKETVKQPEFLQLFSALGKLAPYCGTGHKTTFGLGQTRLGWSLEVVQDIPDVQTLLAKRIEDLTEIFKAQRQRTGGDRADKIAGCIHFRQIAPQTEVWGYTNKVRLRGLSTNPRRWVLSI